MIPYISIYIYIERERYVYAHPLMASWDPEHARPVRKYLKAILDLVPAKQGSNYPTTQYILQAIITIPNVATLYVSHLGTLDPQGSGLPQTFARTSCDLTLLSTARRLWSPLLREGFSGDGNEGFYEDDRAMEV